MELTYTSKQKWSFWGMIGGVVWLFVGYIFRKALDNGEGTVKGGPFLLLTPWLPLVVSIGCLIVWDVYARRLREEQRATAKGHREAFTWDWRGTAIPRQVLRDLLPPAYAQWTGAPSSFAAVARLLEKAGFPDDLPFKEGELWDYAARAEALWTGDRKRLLDFCVDIYPGRGESPLLDKNQRRQLYSARRLLSEFWDEWGKKCYDEGLIQERMLRSRFQAWELILLTYLEIALALRDNDELPEKQGLFRVGREASRKDKL
jgi:hypothetical protein